MRKLFLLLLAAFTLEATTLVAGISKPPQCDSGGQKYSVGGTICECPTLSGEGGLASGGAADITSRRLVCDAQGRWMDAGSLCVKLHYANASGVAKDEFEKFSDMYCPKANVDPAALEGAIRADNGKFLENASKGVALIAAQALCNRYNLGEACGALIKAISDDKPK